MSNGFPLREKVKTLSCEKVLCKVHNLHPWLLWLHLLSHFPCLFSPLIQSWLLSGTLASQHICYWSRLELTFSRYPHSQFLNFKSSRAVSQDHPIWNCFASSQDFLFLRPYFIFLDRAYYLWHTLYMSFIICLILDINVGSVSVSLTAMFPVPDICRHSNTGGIIAC